MKQPTAIVFPGQGCQRPGMGLDFHDQFEAARRVFDEASNAVGMDLRSLCFEQDERLSLTEYAQPAILTTEIAMLRSVESELGLRARYWGGHSLGEYTALVAAGAMPLADAVRVVRARGRLMQEAVPRGLGRMVAVMAARLDRAAIAKTLAGLRAVVANDNSSQQVVLSGTAEGTKAAEEKLRESAGGDELRFVELEVSAPFHSPLMQMVESAFEAVLREVEPRIDAWQASRVVSNLRGGFHDSDRDSLIKSLVGQISGAVAWRANMAALRKRCTRIVEIGPGRPLRGFFKTMDVNVETVTSARSLQRLIDAGELGAVPA